MINHYQSLVAGVIRGALDYAWVAYRDGCSFNEAEYRIRATTMRSKSEVFGKLEQDFNRLRESGGEGEVEVESEVAVAMAWLVARFYTLSICASLRSLHEELVDRAALLAKPSQSKTTLWFLLVSEALFLPMLEFFKTLLAALSLGSWWNKESYERGVGWLAAILKAAVRLDRELQRANVPAIWIKERRRFANSRAFLRERYGDHWWSALAEMSVPNAPYLTRTDVDINEGAATLRINEETVVRASRALDGIAEFYKLDEILVEAYDYSVHRADAKLRNVHIKNICNGIKSLWALGTLLYPGLFRYEEAGGELVLRVLPPVGGSLGTVMLSVYSLPISRQIIRIYMQTGSVVEELARKEGRRAGAPLLTTASLFNRDWRAEIHDTLVTHPKPPERLGTIDPPMPSIYDQMFRTPVMLAGILHSLVSRVSEILRLEPPIHPDPIRFLESHGVTPERLPPETERLLRSSAALPVPCATLYHEMVHPWLYSVFLHS